MEPSTTQELHTAYLKSVSYLFFIRSSALCLPLIKFKSPSVPSFTVPKSFSLPQIHTETRQGYIFLHLILYPSTITVPYHQKKLIFLWGSIITKHFYCRFASQYFQNLENFQHNCSKMSYFSNTLPAFVKLLIDFHNNYRRNIYPLNKRVQ